MTFRELKQKWDFKPIRNCPGRYVLSPGQCSGSPQELAGVGSKIHEFEGVARDTVLVAAFADGGGLISYRRKDGAYIHTLNTEDGFERKLTQLGITRSVPAMTAPLPPDCEERRPMQSARRKKE